MTSVDERVLSGRLLRYAAAVALHEGQRTMTLDELAAAVQAWQRRPTPGRVDVRVALAAARDLADEAHDLRVPGVTAESSGSDPEAFAGGIPHSAVMTTQPWDTTRAHDRTDASMKTDPTTATSSDTATEILAATGVPVRTSASAGGPGVVLQHSEAGVPVRTAAKVGGPILQHSEAGVPRRRRRVGAGALVLSVAVSGLVLTAPPAHAAKRITYSEDARQAVLGAIDETTTTATKFYKLDSLTYLVQDVVERAAAGDLNGDGRSDLASSGGGSAGKVSMHDINFAVPVPGSTSGAEVESSKRALQRAIAIKSAEFKTGLTEVLDLAVDLPGTAGGRYTFEDLIVSGAIPDPVPLLLPAVQKVREAASRTSTAVLTLTDPIASGIGEALDLAQASADDALENAKILLNEKKVSS